MIAAFIAFGVSAHLAVLAVLGYRTISYWLPTIPGAIAYWRLRRELKSSPEHLDARAKSVTGRGRRPVPAVDARRAVTHFE